MATVGDSFDSLVLQGGGCRSFFTLGFLEAAGSSPALADVKQLVAVSAGAAMACAHLIGAHGPAFECFARAVRNNPRNFYLSRLLTGRHPMPHYAMYRQALLDSFSESQFAELRAHKTRLRIVVSRSTLSSAALTVGLGAYYVLTKRQPPGLTLDIIEAQSLQSRVELCDAILASSAFPPFTPTARRQGWPVIDGGALAPIPLVALDQGTAQRPLVILTKPRPVAPLPAGTRFIAPPEDLRLATWEYSDEPALHRVYTVGRRLGEQFLRTGETQRA